MEQTNILHPGHSQNDPNPKSPIHMSKLNLSNRLYDTYRFGQIGVCDVFDSDPKDSVPMQSAHTVRSYTLSSPLLSDVTLKKDSFQVPRRAILPLNWDKIIADPPLGDDVAQNVGSTVENFSQKISTIYSALAAVIGADTVRTTALLHMFQFLSFQCFYSYGSLIASLGYSMQRHFSWSPTGVVVYDCDGYVDWFVGGLVTALGTDRFTATIDGVTYYVYAVMPPLASGTYISMRRFLELIHDDPSSLTAVSYSGTLLDAFIDGVIAEFAAPAYSFSYDDAPFDLSFPAAYQMCCAHFYSNDGIDFVYSAEIYRQVVWSIFYSLLQAVSGSLSSTYFTYNGIQTQYDSLSARVFDYVWTYSSSTFLLRLPFILQYVSVLFAWRRSLRFNDYFVSGRAHPLSVGIAGPGINIPVASGSPNTVSVIDVVASTLAARFKNAANRARRKIGGYLEDIFHSNPSHDWHDPLFLGHISDTIYSVDVENTGSAQLTLDAQGNPTGQNNSVTSSFKSNGEKYLFEVDVKEHSILITLCFFDITRSYAHATRRMFFHRDRFDFFNPFMQTMGDQKLYLRELTDESSATPFDSPFAYKNRHAEFKESFDRSCGGFASGALKTWSFTDDASERGSVTAISPDFIRSSCVELDRYFLSLTGWSLGTYFHFVVCNYNKVHPTRNMIVSPEIL